MSRLEKIKVGFSPLSETIQLYRMGVDPECALETKDVTLEVMSAVVEHLTHTPNGMGVLHCYNQGVPKVYQVTVTDITEPPEQHKETLQ
jgi:hypothetical protein